VNGVRRRVGAVVAGSVVLALGASTVATASNGQAWLLGRTGHETHPTTIRNSHRGPALSLVVPAHVAPLRVSSSTKVVRLNADEVDGLSSGSLTTNAIVGTYHDANPYSSSTARWSMQVPPGNYAVSFAVALVGSSTATPASPITYACETLVDEHGSGGHTGVDVGAFSHEVLLSGSDTISVPSSNPWIEVTCKSSSVSTFGLEAGQGVRLTATPINSIRSTALGTIQP